MYSLVHAADVMPLRKAHVDLLHKGQVMTGYYRIINKTGGYVWLQTCATLICNSTSSASASAAAAAAAAKRSAAGNETPTPCPTPLSNPSSADGEQEQSIICVNYVIR